MFRLFPALRRKGRPQTRPVTTDPDVKRQAVEQDEELKSRLQQKIGRDIQPDIDRIVHRAQRGIRGTQ